MVAISNTIVKLFFCSKSEVFDLKFRYAITWANPSLLYSTMFILFARDKSKKCMKLFSTVPSFK